MQRNSAVFYRDLNHEPAAADSGLGSTIREFVDGAHAIDLSSGAGVTCLGHTNKDVKTAMREQLTRLPYVHAANWTNSPAERLAYKLLELAGGHFTNGRVIFLNTGAEAVEAACKLSVQYHLERDGGATPTFYARQHSYHGASGFTLQLGDHPRKIDYRNHMGAAYIGRMRAFKPNWDKPANLALYRHDVLGLLTNGMRHPATVVIEPIGGTAVAIEPADATYLAQLRATCKNAGALLIYDEVLCGNYRTNRMFAYQAIGTRSKGVGLQPDMLCIGKGLTAGYFPLSAVIVADHVIDTIKNGTGRLWHSTTNQNHPLGCAAGIAALNAYENLRDTGVLTRLEGLIDNYANILKKNPNVQDVTGFGSLRAIRLHASGKLDHRIMQRDLLRRGVAVYTEGHTVTGTDNMILVAPPYCITADGLATAFAIVDAYLMEQVL